MSLLSFWWVSALSQGAMYDSFGIFICLFWHLHMSLLTSSLVSFDILMGLHYPKAQHTILLTSSYVSFDIFICLFWHLHLSLLTFWWVCTIPRRNIRFFWHLHMSLLTSSYVSFDIFTCLFWHFDGSTLSQGAIYDSFDMSSRTLRSLAQCV